MGIEIERKFLVTGDGWRDAAQRVVPMAQGYLNDLEMVASGAMHASVRVRIEGDVARLNIKSRELGACRQEFEYDIPVADGRALLALAIGGRIEKRRHYVEHAGLVWEVDEFLGDNEGLIIAEIELKSEDETFKLPPWVKQDVTGDKRYSNARLSRKPYGTWKI